MTDNKKSQVFRYLKESLSDLQRNIHNPKGRDGDSGYNIYSPFYVSFKKIPYYAHYPERLRTIVNESNSITFVASHDFDGILYNYVKQRLPMISVTDSKYEICWGPDIAINSIESVEFKVSDIHIAGFDDTYITDYNQTMIAKNHNIHDINHGNVPWLTEWRKKLPSHTTSVFLPMPYSKDESTFFPLCLCGHQDRIDHIVKFRRCVKDLLRIRTVDTKEPVQFSAGMIMIDGKIPSSDDVMLPLPEMWGEYLLCEDERISIRSKQERSTYYFDSVIQIDGSNIISKNPSVMELDVESMTHNVHTIYAQLENMTAKENKYYNNFSTNSEDRNYGYGWSPIDSISFRETKAGYIFKDLDSTTLERILPLKHFPSAPRIPGICCWTFGVNAGDYHSIPAINLSGGGKISVKIKDTNPLIATDEADKTEDSFQLKIRMVYTKQVIFNSFPKNDSEKISKRLDLTIND